VRSEPVEDADLLHRIVATASATPQKHSGFGLRWNFSLATDFAALVAIALVGFWIGNAGALSVVVSQQQTTLGDTYLESPSGIRKPPGFSRLG
jgi:hypothetical protein